jgi:hypothetical protein
MFTRRCTQRQFLMRPDEETNNAFIYCLAVAVERSGVELLATSAMGNHHHTVATDGKGNYPQFTEDFHKLFAKCQNALHGRWENFWAAEQPSVVRLEEPADVLDKIIYALTNPVKDHLVEKAIDWPGVSALQALLTGKELTATRPKHFFREDGKMPKKVTLKFHRPKGYEHLTQKEWATLVMERIAEVERKARQERQATGARVLGVKGVLRQRPTERPNTDEPRRALSPRVAAKNKWRRVEALLRNKVFQLAYAKARDAFKRGVTDVVFPAGTYWLVRFAGAQVPLPAQ